MSVKKWVFDLDIKEKTKVPKMTLVQGDTNSNVFEIHLKPDVDLTDTIVTLTFLKEDGNVVVGQAQILNAQNGIISYTCKGNEISYPGTVIATVEIYSADQYSRFTSTQFRFQVIEQLDDGEGIPSTPEYPIITDIINQVKPIIASENERITAENERIVNENIRQTNESNRILAEQDRANAESSRASNEETRILNENNRIGSENIRMANEDIRESNEDTRQSNETNRELAEQNRVAAELLRESAEQVRNAAENERIANENARIAEENIRQANEIDRITAEEARVLAESSRQANEDNRQTAESLRATKETERINAEDVRISNENARIQAENNRALAETDRINAETTRIQNEIDRINAELIRENNESAREQLKAELETLKTQLELLKESLESGNYGDMYKRIYDQNNNGIVDNAEKVNGHTVESDVPADAKFTDTVYDDTVLSNRVSSVEAQLNEHKNSTNNPHNVTAEQIGAETPAGAQAKASVAETNAKNYAETKVSKAGDTMTGTLTISGGNAINFGGKFQIAYNSATNSLDITVVG